MSRRKEVVPSSTGTMRDFLIKQMVKVVKGEQDHPTALSVTRYAQQVYNFCNLELRAANMMKKRGGGNGSNGSGVRIKSLEFLG